MKKRENMILLFLSVALTINSVFFTIQKLEITSFSGKQSHFSLIFLIYFILSVSVLGVVLFFNKKFELRKIVEKILLVFLPTQIILLFTINWIKNIHFYCPSTSKMCILFNNIIPLATVIYFVLVGYLIIKRRERTYWKKDDFFSWFKRQKKISIFVLFAVFALNLGFGLHHLSKKSAVDEALWTFDRIPKYWNNLLDGEWQKTRVSDKPGITVALISGTGLLFVNPMDYKSIIPQNIIHDPKKSILRMNFVFRLPILIFNALMIFVFYFFIEKLLGQKIAVFSSILIGLSPILLGISIIVNPDSLLWVFVPLSMLSYFVYKKENQNKYLYWSGIFLGLSLLTKYVANILYVFFFALIFIEYILNKERQVESVSEYVKKSIIDYFVLVFFSLLIFLVFLPASWLETHKLLEGTVFSQAFQKVWPVFLSVITFIMADVVVFKGKIIAFSLGFFSKYRRIMTTFLSLAFLCFILITMINTYSGTKWYDFESILASPKSSFPHEGFVGAFLASFYSMIFGIMPLALITLIFSVSRNILSKRDMQIEKFSVIYLIIFILLYYFASTVNNVGSTVRYQIVIYPLALIISAIGMQQLLSMEKIKKYVPVPLMYFILIIFSVYSLNSIKPFYFSYASSLLPKEYVLNLKDMGDGSYEAAQYLNSLPNANKTRVWSDKNGVCVFFLGICSNSVEKVKNGEDFDYYVISSGRESRTKKMILSRVNGGNTQITRLDKLYELGEEYLEWKIEIGGRPNLYVKIIKAEKIPAG